MSKQIRLTGTIIIPLDQQDTLLPLLEEHIRLSRAEPGCKEFSVTQDESLPEVYNLQELFENADAFAFHQTRAGASDWGIASVELTRDFTKSEG